MSTILSLFNPETTREILFLIAGGLGIFLYGIYMMGDSLKSLAGNKLKLLINKATSTPLKGILTGAIVTVLIQSSSGTTVIVVGLISAGLMTLKQAVGVIMGVNIGTTITAFLIGLKIGNYAYLFIAIGAFMFVFLSRKNLKTIGHFLLSFGLLFFGLEIMSTGLSPIASSDFFESTMAALSNNWFFALLTGTGLTALVQSSSASIGILQQLYSMGEIELFGSLALLLGANIGTTITIILASLSGSKESKQAALAHIIFNIVGSVFFLILLTPYTALFAFIEETFLVANDKLTIAFAHMFFNIITTTILFIFINQFIKLVQLIMPTKETYARSVVERLNYELLGSSPVIALEASKAVIVEMAQVAKDMFTTAKKYFNDMSEKHYEECITLESSMDFYDKSIHDYLIRLPIENVKESTRLQQAIYLDTIRDLERVGDHCVNLVEFMQDRYQQGIVITVDLQQQFNGFFDQVEKQIQNTIECFDTKSINKAKEIVALEEEIDTLERKFRKAQFSLIQEGILSQHDIHYVDILSNLERISDHCYNIAQNIIDPFYLKRPDSDED